jgi:hypothetical protein
MHGAVILPTATVVDRPKYTQIYIIKWAKKMCCGENNSQDLVIGEEHTASCRTVRKDGTFFVSNKIWR